jgi:hypothetical protein
VDKGPVKVALRPCCLACGNTLEIRVVKKKRSNLQGYFMNKHHFIGIFEIRIVSCAQNYDTYTYILALAYSSFIVYVYVHSKL